MYDASSKQELDSAVEAAAEAALANGALDCCIANTGTCRTVWSVRGGILEGMKADSVAQEECDVVCSACKNRRVCKSSQKIRKCTWHPCREPCGHCGDGNIHTEMLRGPEMSDQEVEGSHSRKSGKSCMHCPRNWADSFPGEHGIGNGRLEFLEEFSGPRMIALYKAIKLAFDDKLIH